MATPKQTAQAKQTAALQTLLQQVQELREQQKILNEKIEGFRPAQEANSLAAPIIRYIADVPFGITFSRFNRPGKFFRVKPTSYLLNSTVVTESLANQKTLIVDVNQATCYFVPLNEQIPLN